jgi:type I restriction enzyme M protein
VPRVGPAHRPRRRTTALPQGSRPRLKTWAGTAPTDNESDIGPSTHNKIVSFIWGIADDVLRDLFKRGKYPDVILPMCVIRRMDAVLEPTKQQVLETRKMLDDAGITEQRAALCAAGGQAFYNTSKFTLRDLKSRGSQQQLLADFEDYLDGFSPNVQDILDNFKFRNQLQTLSKADAIGTLINKFLDPDIDLSPAGIDNHSMGTVFEELVRKFNEENNEEAGEHWTPRDAVRLMANLVFLPIESEIRSGTYLLYDCACGTGGMLTVAEETLTAIATGARPAGQVPALRPGDQPRDLRRLQGRHAAEGRRRERRPHRRRCRMVHAGARRLPRAESSTSCSPTRPTARAGRRIWKRWAARTACATPRFKVMHQGEELSLVTRSSDGQMLFLANMASKMNGKSALGSRIAEVHNGSSLFTGDAGQGESNIRRWLIENDWLEAIVALPLNLFYNTGIATYIWVLSNRKPAHRKGRVQLIDASQWFKPLRKNLGKKNCELSPEDIERISRSFLDFQETPESKIFANAAFGYWKVTVERPLRLHSQLSLKAIETLRFNSGDEDLRAALYEEFGDDLCIRFAAVSAALEKRLADWGNERRPRRRRRRRRHEEGSARAAEEEAARRQDLGTRRPPGRRGHPAARIARRGTLRRPQRLPRPRGRRAEGGRDQARRRRPEADPQGRELARRHRSPGHRQGAQARQGQGRPAARPATR